ncbi:Krueppel-related zinc finger protein 1, partial [Trachymyrmex septentrionalis]
RRTNDISSRHRSTELSSPDLLYILLVDVRSITIIRSLTLRHCLLSPPRYPRSFYSATSPSSRISPIVMAQTRSGDISSFTSFAHSSSFYRVACYVLFCSGHSYVTRRFLEPYHARIMDILSVNYSGSQNVIKRENGPFWQSGKMAYHCPRCNAGYTYKKTLKTHMKYDCGKEPRFKCPYCSKRDKCSSNIYKHIRLRHNGKPVYVDRLESSRSSNSSFHIQLSGWRSVRPVTSYICAKCNAGFRRTWDLIRHKCGQTPRYACPYCHKKDNSSSNVYRHIRRWHPNHPVGAHQYEMRQTRKRGKVYSVNKSHYCPRCNRGFTLKKNMSRHLRHECGMAPKYQCPYCDKLSKFTQNIYAHIRKYHPGQALCFRRFKVNASKQEVGDPERVSPDQTSPRTSRSAGSLPLLLTVMVVLDFRCCQETRSSTQAVHLQALQQTIRLQ